MFLQRTVLTVGSQQENDFDSILGFGRFVIVSRYVHIWTPGISE